MAKIRQPAVAGTFYPESPDALERAVRGYLEAAEPSSHPAPKALIAPHAGYVYSGPVAGSAYASLAARREEIRCVVLLGPAHRVAVRGLAAPEVEAFTTPLGRVPLDRERLERVLALPQVVTSDAAHAFEHSLEVELPFLQTVVGDITLLPVAVGDTTTDEVAEQYDPDDDAHENADEQHEGIEELLISFLYH